MCMQSGKKNYEYNLCCVRTTVSIERDFLLLPMWSESCSCVIIISVCTIVDSFVPIGDIYLCVYTSVCKNNDYLMGNFS